MSETKLSGALLRQPLNTLSIGDVEVPSGSLHVGGTSVLQQILEKNNTTNTAASGVIDFNVLDQGIMYYTANASGNWTINFRGSSSVTLNDVMYIGQSLSTGFLVTNGSPAYYASAHTIDGVSVIPKWSGGSVPTAGTENSIDAYSYSIFKTANATFTVLATRISFS